MSKGLFKYIKDVEIDFENQYDHFVNIYDHFAINKLLKLTKPLILSHTRLYKLPHATITTLRLITVSSGDVF